MIKLMNAAVMPRAGVYRVSELSASEFADALKSEEFQSFVGYDSTAKHIESIAGVSVPVCRDQAAVEDGDRMLVCRLKARLSDPTKKADKNYVPAPEDYEYLLVVYQEG